MPTEETTPSDDEIDFRDRPHPAATATAVGLLAFAVLNLVGLLAVAAMVLIFGGAK